jgi:hypothetical protein
VQTNFALLSNLERDEAAQADIGTTLQVSKQITGVGTITEEVAIEGIEAVIDFAAGHTVRFYTSDVTIVELFVLDTSLLDDIYVLG